MAHLLPMQQMTEKWLAGTNTDKEKQKFEAWYNSHPTGAERKGDASEQELKEKMMAAITQKIKVGASSLPVNTSHK